jgi:hypothetical protein
MSFVSYPSAADIEALLKSSSYWPFDANKQDFARLQADIGARAAADEWERLTGWSPFVANSNVATPREFWETDSRGRVDFQGGAISIESVSVGGVVISAGGPTGYRVKPENAVSRKTAITHIDLGGRYGYSSAYSANPIVVTALWGRVRAIPGDVWQAIQQKAALIALTQIENLQSISSISEDGFTKAYDVVGIVTQKDLVNIWGKDFEKIACRWQRVVC